MLTANRWVAFAVIAAALVGMTPAAASADDGIGGVDCSQQPQAAECDVNAGLPGGPGGGNGTGGGVGNGSGGGSGGEDVCHYERLDPQPAARPGAGTGAWYTRVCPFAGGAGGAASEAVWLDAAEAADPEMLALAARSRLRLPVPAIRTNPDASRTDVLVTVPVWLWVDDASWGARSATASVPGLSVTAVATPTRVVWRLGDGGSVTCGKGTAWTPGTDPLRASPTCGHRYVRPGDVTLTAVITWRVTWSGGGRSGSVPDLTSTGQAEVRVVEAPALNAAGRR